MSHSAGSIPDSRLHYHLAISLLIVAAAALILRVPSIAEPLGIDQSLWASAARGMARGQLLYRDVWEQRPPGIYWVYLAGFHLFGWTSATVAWLDILAAAATTIALCAIALSLAGRLTAALAAALYAGLTMPSWLYGNGGFLERAVSETFIVVCICGCAWSVVQWHRKPSAAGASVMGLFAGAALIFKPNAGLYFPALLLWMFLFFPEEPAAKFRGRISQAAVACLTALVVPAITLLWLWKLDLLHDAATAVIDFNRYYVGEGFSVSLYTVVFAKAIWLRIKTEPLWLAGAVGIVVAAWTAVRDRRLPPLPALAVLWGAAGTCVIVVNGARLFNSYFIQVLPPLALLGAWALIELLRGTRARRLCGIATVSLMAILLVQRDYAGRVFGTARTDFEALSAGADRAAYLERFGGYGNGRGYSARANAEVAEYVRVHSGPEDRIFLFGINGAGIYFDADRLTAHRFLRVNFFVETEFPDPDFRLDAVVRDLEAARPTYIVFERLHRSSVPSMQQFVDALPEHPLVRGLLSKYRLETRIEDFTVYRRIDDAPGS